MNADDVSDRPSGMAGRPAAEAPPVQTDVLSDVLGAIRLTGAIYFDFELSSPWVREAPPAREIAARVMPGAQRVIEYHLIARGSCWGHAVGHEPILLRDGDVIMFPRGDGHVLSSAPGMREVPDPAAFDRPAALPVFYEFGGGGPDRARVVCCFLGCDDRPYNPLVDALPPVIHLAARDPQHTTAAIASLVAMAASEARAARPGSGNVLARLSELIFVETIRQHLAALPDGEKGWLAGLRDPVVGCALAAIHGCPRDQWTVERLARAAGVSRSVLADRFAQMAGHPPMQYLALWRMQLAARMLADGRRVAAVADAVGYESEAAFSRAFKKIVGDAPAAWRGAHARPSASAARPAGGTPRRASR